MMTAASDPDDMIEEIEFIAGLLREPEDLRRAIRGVLFAGARQVLKHHPGRTKRETIDDFLANVGSDLFAYLDAPAFSETGSTAAMAAAE